MSDMRQGELEERALITTACYVAAWEMVYYGNMVPGFAEKYAEYEAKRLEGSGATPEQIAKQQEETKKIMALYDNNPLFNVAITFLEPLPVALLMILISALILRKRPKAVLEEEVAA